MAEEKTIRLTSKEFLRAGAQATSAYQLLEGKKLKKKGITEKDVTEISAGISAIMLRAFYPDMDTEDLDEDASELVSERLEDLLREAL